MKRFIILASLTLFILSASVSLADDAITKACPNGVKPKKSLINTKILQHSKEKGPYGPEESISYVNNIVNKNGECFEIDAAKFVHLVDKKHAICKVYFDSTAMMSIDPQYLLLDYGESTIKNRHVAGIIKATGKYAEYKDKQGIPRKMPQFIVVKENGAR